MERVFAIVDVKLADIMKKIEIPSNIDIKGNLSLLVANKDIVKIVKKMIEDNGEEKTLQSLMEVQNVKQTKVYDY